MKKYCFVLYLLMIFAVFVSCVNEGRDSTELEGEYWGVTNHDYGNLYDSDFQFEIEPQLAVEIGTAVLKNFYGEEQIADTKFIVEELEGQDVYIVSRSLKSQAIAGGGYTVAIRKSTGEIINIWESK